MDNTSGLCARGCGFYGNPDQEGMCSKCFKEYLKENKKVPQSNEQTSQERRETKNIDETDAQDNNVSVSSGSIPLLSDRLEEITLNSTEGATNDSQKKESETKSPKAEAKNIEEESKDSSSDEETKKPAKKRRCHACKKKVGLTALTCRCGGIFCGQHRYSDKHDCTFDYKKLGKEQLIKLNPLIVGDKYQKF